ncbi:MAG: HigA family addiction module antitoxin [Aliidongia sp.]
MSKSSITIRDDGNDDDAGSSGASVETRTGGSGSEREWFGVGAAGSVGADHRVLNGKRSVSPDTALRLARYFGNSARFWANLQTAYDLAVAERESGARISVEVAPAA